MAMSTGGGFGPGDPSFDAWKALQDAMRQQQIMPQQNSQTWSNVSPGYYKAIQYGNAIQYGGLTPSQPPPAIPQVSMKQTFEEGDEISWSERERTFVITRVFFREGSSQPRVDVTEITPGRSGQKFTDIDLVDAIMKKKNKPKKIELDSTKLDALVIKKEVREEILAVLKQFENHDKLFNDWGLGEVIEYGRGMTFMFYGPPGTGKTWGANCIAKALGMELLTIGAAEIQSSEPGGANRAIQGAFKEAKSKHKIVFIDEADSLITSRADLGMVLAGEVNTLLTEIEKFEGVAILATNRIEHMDEALERRISLIVEFPKPDFDNRKKIWAKLLPKKLPLEKGVTPEKLAVEELTGGQIKNVVLQASRMALAGGCKEVSQKHFDMAIARVIKSKNLMGTASRYRQGVVKDDFSVGSGHKTVTKGVKDFLRTKLTSNEDDED